MFTPQFVIQIIVALFLIFYVSVIETGNNIPSKFLFKFLPFTLAIALVLSAFKIV